MSIKEFSPAQRKALAFLLLWDPGAMCLPAAVGKALGRRGAALREGEVMGGPAFRLTDAGRVEARKLPPHPMPGLVEVQQP